MQARTLQQPFEWAEYDEKDSCFSQRFRVNVSQLLRHGTTIVNDLLYLFKYIYYLFTDVSCATVAR